MCKPSKATQTRRLVGNWEVDTARLSISNKQFGAMLSGDGRREEEISEA
jgi:hypothetical protein